MIPSFSFMHRYDNGLHRVSLSRPSSAICCYISFHISAFPFSRCRCHREPLYSGGGSLASPRVRHRRSHPTTESVATPAAGAPLGAPAPAPAPALVPRPAPQPPPRGHCPRPAARHPPQVPPQLRLRLRLPLPASPRLLESPAPQPALRHPRPSAPPRLLQLQLSLLLLPPRPLPLPLPLLPLLLLLRLLPLPTQCPPPLQPHIRVVDHPPRHIPQQWKDPNLCEHRCLIRALQLPLP
ncbi:unnamed protein product, partial [Trypanosoma congolense IL3000]